MLRVCYIVNGRRCSRGVVDELRGQIGLGQVCVTERRGHATEIARRATLEGYDIVVVRGGDGMANEAINGLAPGFQPAFGIDPDGTGKDLSRNLGYDVDNFIGSPEAYREAFVEDLIRSVDLIKVQRPGRTRFCGNLISFGLSALVVDIIDQMEIRTQKMYTKVAKQLAWGMRPVLIKGFYHGLILDVYVTNGPAIAGGILVAPGASMSDGKLELLIVPNINPASRYVLLALARWGWIRSNLVSKLFGVTATWIQNDVTFEALTPTSAQVDGEPLEKPVGLVRVGVEPRRLRVLLPAR